MIDYVFPYVNMNDEVWKRQYVEARRKLNLSTNINSVRFEDNGRLKYLFRGIDKFMPWINKVHMIVSNIEQVPDWIDKEKVHIVLHKDIIPHELLPVFNSTAIEMFLGNIPNLADKFIYGNDDCYPIRKLEEADFFENNIPKIKLKEDKGTSSQFKKVEYNSQRIVADYFGIKLPDPNERFLKVEHTFAPLTKEVCKIVLDKFWKKVYNSVTPFREEKNINQYIYTYYIYFSEIYLPSNRTYKYNALKDIETTIFDIIRNQTVDSVCLNDCSKNKILIEYFKKEAIEAFDSILPDKSKYEKE